MSSFNIIEFTPDHAQAVADMWNNSGEGWGGDLSIRSAADILAEIRGGAYVNVYLAEKDGEILGYASLSKYFGDSSALYLHVLNVRPAWHGQKIGKALVLQCVNRTIALGFPRLDIHTWAGNTKAVPLYKKCGYMWEDRTDSTHLVNFIPTVLGTDACKDFFKTADWYGDSTRVIDVKPDGVKENLFEVFRYDWKKDGRMLSAGFERTGRRMRLLETDGFKITLSAETHEPAFGLDYECAFEVINKTDAPLELKILGRDDGTIRFPFSAEESVLGAKILKARFHAGEISEPQDIWRVHPCVLADVWLNGRHVEMGMGVETKWPVELELMERRKISRPGAVYDAYFNLTNSVNNRVAVKLSVPENAGVTRFIPGKWETSIPTLGKTSIKVKAAAVSYGHEAVPVAYEVTLPSGRTVKYTRPLHAVSRGLTGMCGFETERDYVIQNGLWQIGINKLNGYGWTHHLLYSDTPHGPGFPAGQLCETGASFTDEFTRVKPADVKMYRRDETMIMEAAYRSEIVAGVGYTHMVTLTANGVLTRRHRLTNTGGEAVRVSLCEETHSTVGQNTIIPCAGIGFQSILGGLINGTWMTDQEKINENWLFDDRPRNPLGICWPKEYKPVFRWSDCLMFEHTDIRLAPGGSFETEPVMLFIGLFHRFSDFRDFVTQAYTPVPPPTVPHIDWRVNGGNPFTEGKWASDIAFLRNVKLEGEISLSVNGVKAIDGRQPDTPGEPVSVVALHMNMESFETVRKSAAFVTDGAGTVAVTETDGVFTADNGAITFKTDPKYSNACYSLSKDGREWLMTGYPEHRPYSWMNPFIGGISELMEQMNNAMIVRERITAAPAERTDSFGNVWKGFATAVAVEKFEKYKGVTYTQFFLTLPGLPVLCTFTRLANRSGAYKIIDMSHDTCIGVRDDPEQIRKIVLSGTDAGGTHIRLRAGAEDWGRSADRLAAAEIKGVRDKLYVYRNTPLENSMTFWADRNTANLHAVNIRAETEDGASADTPPLFFILTEKELDADMLRVLDGVRF